MTLLDAARARFPTIWTIYDSPRDFPGRIVIRRWFGDTPDPSPSFARDLEEARALVQADGASVNLGRDARDDAAIAESWI